MIYCIIATDPTTHNEWVMPKTVETISEAEELIQEYWNGDSRFEYRIELVAPKAEHYADTDSLRTAFTALELFPPRNNLTTSDCGECGAYVKIQQQNLHAAWHNKIADL